MAFIAHICLHHPQEGDINQYTAESLGAMNNELRLRIWNSNFTPLRSYFITLEKDYRDLSPAQSQIIINNI